MIYLCSKGAMLPWLLLPLVSYSIVPGMVLIKSVNKLHTHPKHSESVSNSKDNQQHKGTATKGGAAGLSACPASGAQPACILHVPAMSRVLQVGGPTPVLHKHRSWRRSLPDLC